MSTDNPELAPENQRKSEENKEVIVPDLSFLTTLPGASHTKEEIEKINKFSEVNPEVPASGNASNTGAASNTPEVKDIVDPDSPENTGSQTPEVFAKILSGTENQSAEKPKDIKEIMGIWKSKYEIDLESADGLSALQEKYEQLLEKSGSTEKATKELQDYKNHLQSLPEPIKQAIIAAEKGQDFQEAYDMAVGRIIDFSKPFESHKDTYELVKKMLPRLALTRADFEDDPDDSRVQDAIELAKEKYGIKQIEYKNLQAAEAKKQEAQIEGIKKSIERAFSHAANVFKNPESQDLKRIKDILAEGRFDDLFFDKQGFREDAIEKLIYAEYGSKMISEQAKIINGLNQQIRSLSNQIAEINGKSPDISAGGGKGLGSPKEIEVQTPEERNESLDNYNEYLKNRRSTKY